MNTTALFRRRPLQNHCPARSQHVLARLVESLKTWCAPTLVISLAILAHGGPVATCSAVENTPTASLPSRAEMLTKAYHERGEFDGVVLVAEGDRVRYLGAFGPAGPDVNAASLTPQTVFPTCSITKQFTAVLTLQLVDAGRLRLDSTLGELLPEFRLDEAGRAITVRQLLVHSSGLPDLNEVLPEQDGVEGFYRLESLDFAHPLTVLQRYLRAPLRFPPGERFAYNNSDYWTLGVIIEKLAGQPYETLLKEKLLAPLGMMKSGLCTPAHSLPADCARGRVVEKPGSPAKPAPELRLENFWAAGAMFSTAEDLLRWSVALDEGRLLSAAMQREMFTPDPKLGFVALGSWVYRTSVPEVPEKALLVERQGEIAAFHALSLRLPERHGHVLLLSNLDVVDLNSTYMKKGLPFELVRSFFPAVPPR